MKKILSMLLVLMMLLTASVALADGMGVQVIGGPETETEPVSLDDMKLNIDAEIDGYAILTPTSFVWLDTFEYYHAGGKNSSSFESGADAEYALLRFDITNTKPTLKNFLENVEVKAIYDDSYEYAGWFYQYDYNHGRNWTNQNSEEIVILKDEFFAVDPMYTGHYCFGCTLPNAVVNSKKPLRLVITIDGNELTYNIRK